MMIKTKVIAAVLAGGVAVGGLSLVATQSSDNIFDGLNSLKDKVETLWNNESTLKQVIEDKNTQIKSIVKDANATITAKLTEIGLLKTQIEEKDVQISEIQKQLEEQAAANGEEKEALAAQLAEAKDAKEALEQELQALSTYVDQVKAELQTKGITDESVKPVEVTQFDLSEEETKLVDASQDSSIEDDTTEQTPEEVIAAKIKNYILTEDTNTYPNLAGHGVQLIDGDAVRVVVQILGYEPEVLGGKPEVKISYVIKDGTTVDGSTTFKQKTLASRITDQTSTIKTKFDVTVGELSFVFQDGKLHKKYINGIIK